MLSPEASFCRRQARASPQQPFQVSAQLPSAQEKVDLTIWAWTPNTQAEIDLFYQTFPHISVKLGMPARGRMNM